MAIWRVCEALAQWGQANGVRRLRREDDEADGWEDIVEDLEDDGRWLSRRIQVKAHGEEISRQAFVPLLETLGDGRPRLLLLRDSSVRISGIGLASRLRDLTERAREPDAERAVQTAGARTQSVLENICHALGDESATATLRRLSTLHVEFTGSEKQLESSTKRILGTQFADPDSALERIASRVRATARYAETLDIHDLRRQLADLHPPNVAVPPGLEARRRAYLEGLISDINARSPLGEACTTAFALREVMVDRSVAGEDDVGRPLGAHLADAIARGTKRIALSGAVGIGKSVEVARLARDLAESARRDPQAPIPLLLAARDHRVLAGPDALAKTILDTGAQKVILLDGMDEAQATDTTLLSIDNLCGREDVLCILAAGRPGSTPAGWPVLRLDNWTSSTREWFLARWAALDEKAVDSFRELSCIEEVASTPLLATYALLVARDQPEALASRTDLFEALITKVFIHWVAKGGSIDDRRQAADHWSSLEPLFARLAWESLTTGSIEGSSIRFLLREELGATHADIALECSRRQLGLLIEDGDGYRFASRPIADHLAGEHLARHPDLARPVSPLARWREPLLQSASILVAAGTPEPVIAWIRALLPSEASPLQVGRTIRRVSLAAELAVELDEGADPVAKGLADALFLHLTEECSIWAGDEAADVCRTVAAHGGPVWRQLQPMIQARLASGVPNPARWYLAQEGTQEFWLSALFHRDPGTRAEAVQRLLGNPSLDPDSTLFLLGTANEAGVAGFLPSPMHVGASLLAHHLEEDPTPELVLLLRQWLYCGFQRREIFAAISLPKGIDELRRAEVLTSVRTVYGPVLDTLLRLEGAHGHLDETWPGWRDQAGSHTLAPLEQPGPVAPPSKVARRRMLRVLGTEERFGRELLETKKQLDYEETETLCRLALTHPTLATELLGRRGERPPGLYSVRAMELLAPAVAEHPSVRDALILMVRELEGNWAHSCPGAALERIAHTDEEAR